jgi:uncharacterized membrane protein
MKSGMLHRFGFGFLMGAILLRVGSAQTVPAAEEDIREAREVIAIPAEPVPSYVAWWIAGGVVVLTVAVIFLMRWLRLRRPGASAMSTALAALRVIESDHVSLDDEAFASRVADVLRVYVVKVHGIAAPQRTSQEFLQECLRQQRWDKGTLEHLRLFLRSCDLAKFAALSLTASARQSLVSQARELVLAPLPAEGNKESSAA